MEKGKASGDSPLCKCMWVWAWRNQLKGHGVYDAEGQVRVYDIGQWIM